MLGQVSVEQALQVPYLGLVRGTKLAFRAVIAVTVVSELYLFVLIDQRQDYLIVFMANRSVQNSIEDQLSSATLERQLKAVNLILCS